MAPRRYGARLRCQAFQLGDGVSFPSEAQWGEVAALIGDHLQEEDRVIAPLEFGERLPRVVPYRLSRISSGHDFQWVVLHKGLLTHVDRTFLDGVLRDMRPVLANEVFVVYSSREDVPRVDIDDPHVQALAGLLPFDSAESETDGGAPRFQRPQELAWLSRHTLEAVSREAAQSCYLGGGTALCRALTRYLVYVDTTDVGVAPHLLLDGCWEPWITLAVARAVHEGSRCLDLGTNHGYYALLMADAVGPEGRVLACEPNPRLAALVQRTLEVNGLGQRVDVVNRAVTDHGGDRVVLHHEAARMHNASLYVMASPETREIGAETVSVDELVADWPRVDVVKVDVEGAEEALWRGMRRTLEANPEIVVLMEFNSRRQYDARQFLERIRADGFPLRFVDADAEIRELPMDRCLSEGPEWMLYLRRT
jgi:FkbM family methyltransferase